MKFKQEDIKLLLENYYVEPSESYAFNNKKSALFSGEESEEVEVEKDLSHIEFTQKQVNSIRKLYVKLSPQDKIPCRKYLIGFLEIGNNPQIASLAASALIHLGFFNDVFQKVTLECKSYQDEQFYVPLLESFGTILKNDWKIFTKQQIDEFYEWVNMCLDGKNELGKEMNKWSSLYEKFLKQLVALWRKLNIIKTKTLQEEIFSETSQEITTDERALKEEFKRHNFPDYLSETLDEIDLKISTANSNFDFKGCMDLIRSFSESLFKHIADSLDSTTGKTIDGTDSEEAAKFFIKHKLISENQGKVLVALRHFLSNEGVHRLKSRPDDARLSRNMMIEVGLYLLLRLKDIKA